MSYGAAMMPKPRRSPSLLPTDEEVRQGALDYVNEWRAMYDIEPLTELPRGLRGISSRCPIGLAIKPVPTGAKRGPQTGSRLVQTFVLRFDHGDYPDLVE